MTELRERMLEDMRIRNLSPQTQRTYISHVRRFAEYFKTPPDRLGPKHIRDYQAHLVRESASESALRGLGSSLRFLYRVTLRRAMPLEYIPLAKKAKRLPVVLSTNEVARMLAATSNRKPWPRFCLIDASLAWTCRRRLRHHDSAATATRHHLSRTNTIPAASILRAA